MSSNQGFASRFSPSDDPNEAPIRRLYINGDDGKCRPLPIEIRNFGPLRLIEPYAMLYPDGSRFDAGRWRIMPDKQILLDSNESKDFEISVEFPRGLPDYLINNSEHKVHLHFRVQSNFDGHIFDPYVVELILTRLHDPTFITGIPYVNSGWFRRMPPATDFVEIWGEGPGYGPLTNSMPRIQINGVDQLGELLRLRIKNRAYAAVFLKVAGMRDSDGNDLDGTRFRTPTWDVTPMGRQYIDVAGSQEYEIQVSFPFGLSPSLRNDWHQTLYLHFEMEFSIWPRKPYIVELLLVRTQ